MHRTPRRPIRTARRSSYRRRRTTRTRTRTHTMPGRALFEIAPRTPPFRLRRVYRRFRLR
jgi:hypothetical protein